MIPKNHKLKVWVGFGGGARAPEVRITKYLDKTNGLSKGG